MNTNTRRLLVGLGALVAVSSAAYFLIRTESSPETPQADRRPAALQMKSPARSTENTSRQSGPFHAEAPVPGRSRHTQFRDLNRCFSNMQAAGAAKDRADCSFYEGKPLFERQYAQCLARAQDEVNAMHSAADSMRGCPTDERSLINSYYEATKAAARAGSDDAQYCYLFSYFQDSQGHSHYTQQDIEDYKRDSVKYVADAFARGDWRIVTLLSTRFIDPPRSLITMLDGAGQPETIYKMKALLRLGARGAYAVSLDDELNAYRRPTPNGSTSLSKDTLAAANKWAQEIYEQHFQGQKPLTEQPQAVCRPTD